MIIPRSLSDRVRKMERDKERPRKKQKLDFLKNVNALDFLERCEVANVSQATSDEILYSCPFPGHSHGDEKPSAYMNDGTKDKKLNTAWKCHGCGRGGNAVSFLAEHEGISRQQAIRELRNIYGAGYAKPQGGISSEFDKRRDEREREQELAVADPLMEIPKRTAKQFEVDWPSFEDNHEPDVQYMYGRGFSTDDLMHWGIGYDHQSKRITIPIHDHEGRLVGFKGRAWQKGVKPKYIILGDTPSRKRRGRKAYGFEPYEKSLVVFGLSEWGEQKTYVMDEGEINVMVWRKLGIPSFSTGGAHISDTQAKLVRDHCDEVIMFLDDDSAGSNGIWGWDDDDGEHHPGAVDKLSPFIKVRLVGKHKHDVNEYVMDGKEERVHKLLAAAKPHFKVRRAVL